MKGQGSLIQVRQAKLGRTNSGRSYIVKKSNGWGTDPAKRAFYRAFRDFNPLNDFGIE